MTIHPEQKSTEIYVGNIRPEQLAELATTIPSARLGVTAYGVDGDKLSASEGVLPLFVGRGQDHAKYDILMMERTFGPSRR